MNRGVILAYQLACTLVDPLKVLRWVPNMSRFAASMARYAMMPGSEPLSLLDLCPCVHDATASTPFDPHYVHQSAWALRCIRTKMPATHVDVGSSIAFVGALSALVDRVEFVDIRPAPCILFHSIEGTVLQMPYADLSVSSLSSLHVIEHVGLGRYGDPLDPQGSEKAAAELSRILAVEGQLLVSVPVGRPRVAFNAHRVHSPQQVLELFKGLKLLDFSWVDDQGRYFGNAHANDAAQADYACGMFRFTKER